MEPEIFHNDLIIEKLTDDQNISNFDCGDKELNGFLCENSLPEMRARINVTYLCRCKSTIVAYFTLSSDSIKINSEDRDQFKEKGIKYKQFPAMKIGRLAVDKKFQKKGIGTEILLRVVGYILQLSDRLGMRFISVDAYAGSAEFYRKNNFIELLKGSSKKYTAMYFDPFRSY